MKKLIITVFLILFSASSYSAMTPYGGMMGGMNPYARQLIQRLTLVLL